MDNVLADIIDEKHLEVQALAAAKDFSTLDYAAKSRHRHHADLLQRCRVTRHAAMV